MESIRINWVDIMKQDTAAVQAAIEKKVRDNANWIDGKMVKNYLGANKNMGSRKR